MPFAEGPHPDRPVEALLDIDAIEVRASPVGADHTLYRADDEILLALRHISFADQSLPLIHLRQATYGGLFDRLAHDFDDRWDKATPLTSRKQLPGYLADTEVEPWTEPDQSPNRTRHCLARHHGHRRLRPPRPEKRRAAGHDDPLDSAPAGAASPAGHTRRHR
ncbi:MAG: hypothetical protein ACR2JH_10010 [Solirubrobacteraceae bacterium]